jgi:hypothetical protein
MKHQLSKISALDTAKNLRRAQLLRSRIEELDQQLAILNSKRGLFEELLDGSRKHLQ